MSQPEPLPTPELLPIPLPEVMLDAGGEPASILLPAMGRRIDEMASGQVLEVVSSSPTARMDAVSWCQRTDHELIRLVAEGATVRFWVRKR